MKDEKDSTTQSRYFQYIVDKHTDLQTLLHTNIKAVMQTNTKTFLIDAVDYLELHVCSISLRWLKLTERKSLCPELFNDNPPNTFLWKAQL